MSRRILVVEDEPGLVMALTVRLESEGYTVDAVADGETALERATSERFDLILLDLMLPRLSGFDVCRDLRERGLQTPIIMLTARGQLTDKVVGLKIGATDYVTKPFEMLELLARIEAHLRNVRRSTVLSSGVYQFGAVRVDLNRTEVYRDGEMLEIPAREFKLLRYLIEHRGVTVSRDKLLDEVWGYDASTSTRTVDVHIALLRQKIESNPKRPEHVVTVHGFGYKFLD